MNEQLNIIESIIKRPWKEKEDTSFFPRPYTDIQTKP